MMEPTCPQIPGDGSLRLLALFSQDLDQITELPCLADRILEEFCRITHRPEGALYLLNQNPPRFNRLARRGSTDTTVFPSLITHDHPLVQQLPLLEQTLHSIPRTQDRSLTTHCLLRPSEPDCLSSELVIPLCSRNHLLAFVMLTADRNSVAPNLSQMELVAVMVHIAATTLDTILIKKEWSERATPLMRSADRLHTVEYMADGWAHAVRNPLTSIKAFVQLAGERKDDPQFVSTFSQMALEDVRRLEQLTQEIFDYVRYRQPNQTEEDLNDIVSSCLYFLELTIRHRRIKIEKDLAPEPPRGMVDKQHIQQALLSLLMNAVEAIGPSGGLLRVRTGHLMKPNGTAWSHIDIEDTGRGLSVENLARIFDPFFTTNHQAGDPKQSGLGLTIAQHIINAHQGEIHVQSMEGVGTTRSIYLPLCTV